MPGTGEHDPDLQEAMAEARRMQEGLARLQQRQLAAHRANHQRTRRGVLAAAAVLLLLAGAGYLTVRGIDGADGEQQGRERQEAAGARTASASATASAACTPVRVVTARSFAPVVREVAAGLTGGDACLQAEVVVDDGRSAAEQLARADADVWIPDDLSWQAFAPAGVLAEPGTAGAGSVLATSPVYMLAGRSTAADVREAGSSWVGLARLLAERPELSLVVRDPQGSADGLVAAGSVGEGVWERDGMDASALALSQVFAGTRTLPGAGPALPRRSGEVGLVPEYALLPRLDRLPAGTTVMTGRDRTATLRVGWLPTARAASDPATASALERLRAALDGEPAAGPLAEAGFRRPGADTPPGTPQRRLPATRSKPFGVLEQHHVDHVFATWYPADRRANVLVVVDVSGSMLQRPPGGDQALITVVREATLTLGDLLPAQARLGLWEFGSELDRGRDYRVLLPPGAMSADHRRDLAAAVDGLIAQRTNTGLHDTILAAYTAAARGARDGVPNQVLVFTDGRNEGDPDSISARTLNRRLAAAARRQPEVTLSVLSYGDARDTRAIEAAVKSVDGEVVAARTARDVQAAFVHEAAGGLHD